MLIKQVLDKKLSMTPAQSSHLILKKTWPENSTSERKNLDTIYVTEKPKPLLKIGSVNKVFLF